LYRAGENVSEVNARVLQEETQRVNQRTQNLERQVKKLAHSVACFKGDQRRRHQDYEEDDFNSMDDSIVNLDY
jgi:hypothetical protein